MDIQNPTEPEDDVEYVEENIVAEIIQLDDGEFYVAVPEDAQDFDIDTFNNIQIVVNDDGTETLIFENEPEPEGDETGATGRTQFQGTQRLCIIFFFVENGHFCAENAQKITIFYKIGKFSTFLMKNKEGLLGFFEKNFLLHCLLPSWICY